MRSHIHRPTPWRRSEDFRHLPAAETQVCGERVLAPGVFIVEEFHHRKTIVDHGQGNREQVLLAGIGDGVRCYSLWTHVDRSKREVAVDLAGHGVPHEKVMAARAARASTSHPEFDRTSEENNSFRPGRSMVLAEIPGSINSPAQCQSSF